MDTNSAVKAAIYSRKSKFTGKGDSAENQIEMCKQYLKMKYPKSYSEEMLYVYEDEGFSGKSTNRPEFRKMLKNAREKQFDMIICYRLDRISRNIGDFAKLIEELESLNISFVSIKEQFDTSSPMGRAMMYIASVFSQLERETIAERIKDNMDELAKSGKWLGGVTPTGYCSQKRIRESDTKRLTEYYVLEEIPWELENVRRIFELFLHNKTLSATIRQLVNEGIKTKNERNFTAVTLKSILVNPVYIKADSYIYEFFKKNGANLYAPKSKFNGINGIMAFNKTIQKPGKAHKKQDMSKWIISVGSHRGIIEGKSWVKVYSYFKNTNHIE